MSEHLISPDGWYASEDVPGAVDLETGAAECRRHTPFKWLLLLTLLVTGTGMVYSLWWPSVVRHKPYYWLIPGDFWATFRDAHFIGWGSISYVYSAHSGLVTLPGYPLLLAPLAVLSSVLGLTESSPFVFLPKPQAWVLVGPYVLLSSGVALFGLDRLARAIGVSIGRRRILACLEAAALWATLSIWGHPEDVVALGLCAFCLGAALEGNWTAAGWLLGGAISMQLFSVLIVPVVLAMAGRQFIRSVILRASVLPIFFLGVLIPDLAPAWNFLTRQPNYPSVDHATPWVSLSPSLGHNVVAAGPARIVAVLAACLCGALAVRFRQNPSRLVWLAAVALSGRCIFESVMVPYYVMPAVAVALVCAMSLNRVRIAITAAAGAAVTVVTHLHGGEWLYWGGMTALLLAMLVASFPTARSDSPVGSNSVATARLIGRLAHVVEAGAQGL
jgi:hypothetical protein